MNKNDQLRKHLKFTLIHKLRHLILKKKMGSLGKNVFIEANVKILRYPKNVIIGDAVIKQDLVLENAVIEAKRITPIKQKVRGSQQHHKFAYKISKGVVTANAI